MDQRKGLRSPGAGLGVKLVTLLIILLLFPACNPGNQADEELRREIKDLKKEVKALGEKVDKLEVSQQALLMVLKKPAAAPPEAVAPPPQQQQPVQPPPPPQFQPPAAPAPLTVSQLLAGKDQYLGTRVTVKGEAGPVLVNHKSVMLKSPQGMVEVFFGKLPDPKQVARLTSVPIDHPLTVTGVVSLPPGPAGLAKLQISAEAVDF
jgi:hypothetical protein